MEVKQPTFWQEYKRTIIFAYAILPVTLILPIIFGIMGLQTVASYIGFLPFVISMLLFLKYRNMNCPKCNQHPQNGKNIFYPFDPVCTRCGKRMDIEE